MSVFTKLSYFELALNPYFLSKYPSMTTQRFFALLKSNFDVASYFPDLNTNFGDRFDRYMKTLTKFNFGLFDVFWFIPRCAVSDADSLLKYINGAYVVPTSESTQAHQVVTIMNRCDPEFKMPGYLKSTSLQQEAIDVIPYFVSMKSGKRCIAFGYKKESERIRVKLSSGTELPVLTTGIYGHVLFGEHLVPSEVSNINTTKETFLCNDCRPVRMLPKPASSVTRTLLEEAGFKDSNGKPISNLMGDIYYVDFTETGINDKPRDLRYAEFGDGEETYGYPRVSRAHTVCCIFYCSPPDDGEPADQDECGKPCILPVSEGIRRFKVGGSMPPAFTSHVDQLRACESFVNTLA